MVETRFDNGIFRITLNRPEKHNAFDAAMIARFSEVLHEIPSETRVVLIAGNGKSFCAGADINYMRAQATFSEEQNREDARKLAHMFESIYLLPMPTVAAVHGNVFGGGLGIVAACDVAIATDDARFCFSEVNMGIIPALISPYVLRKTGVGFAKRYFLSAELFTTATAKAAGLISESAATDGLAAVVDKMVGALSAAGNQAQKSAKRLLHAYENFEPFSRDQLIHELAKLRASDDAQARMKKFLEKK
ncbi:MAG: enoyl-CoA hydratase/isomerase family protein [Leptospiraceae bacterium]|nr:enoyl-CoA hydratase/isomerase family protein [Leptospiraceae bacterium]